MNTPTTLSNAVLTATMATGLLLSGAPLQGSVIDFSATAGGGSNWGTGGNWIDGTAPANDITTDIARFNQTSYNSQPNAGTSRSIAGIQIGDGTTNTAALTIGGTTLNLGAGGITMSANTAASSVSSTNLILGADQTWTNNSSNSLSMSSTVSGDFSVEQSGNGLTIFNSAINTFTGGYTLTSGTIYLNRDTSGTTAIDATTTGYSTQSLGAGTVTLNGGVLGSTSSQRYLVNTVTLNGNVQLGVAEKVGAVFLAGAVNVTGDSQLTFINGGGGLYGDTVTLNGNLTLNTDLPYAALGVESSSNIVDGSSQHRIIKTGTGIHILSGTNTYSGGTSINAGTIWAGSTSALGTGTVTFNGGTLDIRNNALVLNAITGTTGTITNSAGSATTVLTVGAGGGNGNFGGDFSQATGTKIIALTKTGSGTQILSGTNAYTGNTIASEGTLQFAKQVSLYNNGSAAAWSASRIVIESGATMAFNLGGSGEFTEANINTLLGLSTGSGGFKDGSFIGLDTTNAGGLFTFNSAIGDTNGGTNSIGLVKLGTGTLAFIESLTFTGDLYINGGTLSFQNASIADTANVSIASGAFFDLDHSDTDTIGSLTIAGIARAIGTYGAIGSGADFQSSTFTGNGLLNVTVGGTAIPEPSTAALLLGGSALFLVTSRRRRVA